MRSEFLLRTNSVELDCTFRRSSSPTDQHFVRDLEFDPEKQDSKSKTCAYLTKIASFVNPQSTIKLQKIPVKNMGQRAILSTGKAQFHNVTYLLPKRVSRIVFHPNGTAKVSFKKLTSELTPTKLRMNETYYMVYILGLNTLVGVFIPLCLLVYLNISIYLELKRTGQRLRKVRRNAHFLNRQNSHSNGESTMSGETTVKVRIKPKPVTNSKKRLFNRSMFCKNERKLTRVSIVIVWLFVVCHMWRLVPNIYEAIFGIRRWPIWLSWADFSVVLTLSYFSVYLCLQGGALFMTSYFWPP